MNAKKFVGKLLAAILTAAAVMAVMCAIVAGIASDRPDLTYNSMDYDVTVEENGDVHVKQIVDVRLAEREDDDKTIPWRQLYGRYTLEAKQATNMTGISVKDLNTGEYYSAARPTTRLPKVYSEAAWEQEYARTWYIADVSGGQDYNAPNFDSSEDGFAPSADSKEKKTVELGWNIPSTKSAKSMKFQLEYTYTDMFTDYKDVARAQISLFDSTNKAPVGSVTARLHLPAGANTKNTWEWFHFEGNSAKEVDSDGTYVYRAWNLKGGEYFDILVMMDRDLMHNVRRTVDSAVKESTIHTEEMKQQAWNRSLQVHAIVTIVLWILGTVGSLVLGIFGLRAAFRNRYDSQYHGPIEYWREPPDMSPAAAAQMLQFVKTGSTSLGAKDEQMGSTLMSLMSKGAISVLPGRVERYSGVDLSHPDAVALAQMLDYQEREGGKRKGENDSTIVIMPAVYSNRGSLGLCMTENDMLEFLLYASGKVRTPVFDTHRMKKALKEDHKAEKLLNKFSLSALYEFKQLHAVKPAPKFAGLSGFAITLIAFLMGLYCAFDFWSRLVLLLCVAFTLLAFGLLVLFVNSSHVLTSPDNASVGQVTGLKRYLEDFSDFSDRRVLDVTMWGRYMVYATAFGISAVALKQLVKAHPEVMNEQWLDNNVAGSSVLYWSLRPTASHFAASGGVSALDAGGNFNGFSGFGDLGSQLSSSFNSISSTVQAASGGGSGGGFGGGGGGGGGGSYGGR